MVKRTSIFKNQLLAFCLPAPNRRSTPQTRFPTRARLQAPPLPPPPKKKRKKNTTYSARQRKINSPMRFNFLLVVYLVLATVTASGTLLASSLLTCMDNSQLTASYLDVVYFQSNKSVTVDMTAISNVDANVTVSVELIVYGLNVLSRNISLCDYSDLASVCPLTSGHLDFDFSKTLSDSITKQIPGVAFTIPDLDARVRMIMYEEDTSTALACVEAVVTNGKTVQTKYAAWPIAAIAGLGLITSGVVSVMGNSNTAAHIASNSMSLFIYFQSLAITSMEAVAKVPPIASAWAQNFVWSLGIIEAGFIQDIANWYLQATGGTPTDILETTYVSISVQKVKRGLQMLADKVISSDVANLVRLDKRLSVTIDSDNFGLSDTLNSTLYTTNEKDPDLGSKILILRGIQRVSYLANIEITSLFMTTIIFLFFFAFVLVACMMFFKAIVEICIRSKIMHEGKFNEYRQQWSSIIKGALYRLYLIAFPQVCVLCIWEFTTHDSAGYVVVAAFLFLVTVGLLGYAAFKVIEFGRRSTRVHKNPAYLLFGDAKFLNKFGFVYVQFRADKYWFVVTSMVYSFLKCLFIAVLQKHGRPQAVIIFVIELVYCVLVCWIRPFMDKRTNVFNITITVINTINALFFMFFSYVFNQPQVVASVMAVVYFVLNAVFALFLLLFTIITCVLALVYKNPDTRYQPMKDDRVSFLPRIHHKGAQQNSSDPDDIELVALGASAMKGHENGGKPTYDDESVYDDDSSQFRKGNTLVDTESYSKNSLSADSSEPQQPASTIVGNSTNAYSGFQTQYNGSYSNNAYSGNASSNYARARQNRNDSPSYI